MDILLNLNRSGWYVSTFDVGGLYTKQLLAHSWSSTVFDAVNWLIRYHGLLFPGGILHFSFQSCDPLMKVEKCYT